MTIEEIQKLTQDQRQSLYADYLYELATETGFGAPRLWIQSAPRNFRQYLIQLRQEEAWDRAELQP